MLGVEVGMGVHEVPPQKTTGNRERKSAVRFRSAKIISLAPWYVGFGYDTGFYEGGSWLFLQIGHRCWGVWWGDSEVQK